MIDALISTAIQWVNVLISLFPDANVNIVSEIDEFMSAFRGAMSISNVFFPVSTLMWAMGLILSVEIALFSFKVYKWLVSNMTFGFLGR